MWKLCIHIANTVVAWFSGFQANLDVTKVRLGLRSAEQGACRARRKPPPNPEFLPVEFLDDRTKPAPDMADLRSSATQNGEEGPGT